MSKKPCYHGIVKSRNRRMSTNGIVRWCFCVPRKGGGSWARQLYRYGLPFFRHLRPPCPQKRGLALNHTRLLTGKRAGRWYAIGDTRKAFIADKTAGEACLKLTMVAMAKELSMRGKTEAHAAMFTPRALLQVDSLLGGYPCLADAVAGRSGMDMSSAP